MLISKFSKSFQLLKPKTVKEYKDNPDSQIVKQELEKLLPKTSVGTETIAFTEDFIKKSSPDTIRTIYENNKPDYDFSNFKFIENKFDLIIDRGSLTHNKKNFINYLSILIIQLTPREIKLLKLFLLSTQNTLLKCLMDILF